MTQATLRLVSTAVLERIRDGLSSSLLRSPLDRASLIGFGIQHSLDDILRALGGHQRAACMTILEVALSERDTHRPGPELVWTGPEAINATARDTAVVLRALFEGARESVILAGYSFDHARDVLAPLHEAMLAHGVAASFFVDVPQIKWGVDPGAHLTTCLGGFRTTNWPFGEPSPTLYYDKRSLVCGPPWSSLHAKCVVVDGKRAFVSSANFTQRGQERNIEVGVLIEDATFASYLAGQWMGLVQSGLVGEFRVVAA